MFHVLKIISNQFFSAFTEIFGYLINDYLLAIADGSMTPTVLQLGINVPSFDHIYNVLQCVVNEIQRFQNGEALNFIVVAEMCLDKKKYNSKTIPGDRPSIEDDIHQQTCEDC